LYNYYKFKSICWDKILHEVNYWLDMHANNRVFRTRVCPENSMHKIGIFLHFLCLKHTTSLVMSLGNIYPNHLSHHTNTICCCIWSSDQCTKISFVNSSWQTYKKQILSEMWVNYWIIFRSNLYISWVTELIFLIPHLFKCSVTFLLLSYSHYYMFMFIKRATSSLWIKII